MPVASPDLPLSSPVAELRREAGRTRVTFTRLAAIYYLEDAHPDQARILRALEESRASGRPVQLTYTLPGKTITGLVAAAER